MNLSNYLSQNCGSIVTEAINAKDLGRAEQLIDSYLKKRKIYTWGAPGLFEIDGHRCFSIVAWNEANQCAMFNWSVNDRKAQIYSVVFIDDYDNWTVAQMEPSLNDSYNSIEVEAKGASIITMIKLVENVLTGKIQMSVSAIKNSFNNKDLYESVEEDFVNINEDMDAKEIGRQKLRIKALMRSAKSRGEDTSELEAELAALEVGTVKNVTSVVDKTIKAAEIELEERATPDERFEDMEEYVDQVIEGLQPLALLCGAPGVGKTYRILNKVKSNGLQKSYDWELMKGKCTPTALYMILFEYQNPGQLIVFDDCDSIFKDDDAINLLKAAYDSSDERWVAWGVSRPIPMSTEKAELLISSGIDVPSDDKGYYYPRTFLYQGSGIIITNLKAGKIDTAIRNRALICDLDFTPQETMGLVRQIAPSIQPDLISPQAKMKAIEFLEQLIEEGKPVEISIRSFAICARQFNNPNAQEKAVRRRIAEQMKNLSLRGGGRY